MHALQAENVSLHEKIIISLYTSEMVSTGFLAIGFGVVVEVVEGGVFFNDSKQFSSAGVSSWQHHTCRFSPSQIWFLNCENKGWKY